MKSQTMLAKTLISVIMFISISSVSFADCKSLQVSSPAVNRTGQWWCDNHFGNNLGGKWFCVGNNCKTGPKKDETVKCLPKTDLDSIDAYSPAPGRTGQWWCKNHFENNLGGKWYCIGGNCKTEPEKDETVFCGQCDL